MEKWLDENIGKLLVIVMQIACTGVFNYYAIGNFETYIIVSGNILMICAIIYNIAKLLKK